MAQYSEAYMYARDIDWFGIVNGRYMSHLVVVYCHQS